MHVALTDIFRCPAPHPESSLVVAAHRTVARVVLDGIMGCPVCGAEYPIRDGVTSFAPDTVTSVLNPIVTAAPVTGQDDDGFREREALRLAAMLDASDAMSTIAVIGVSLSIVGAMQRVSPARVIAVNPPDDEGASDRYGLEAGRHSGVPLAIIRLAGPLPLADGCLSGLAIDASYASQDATSGLTPMLGMYLRALRPGGRLLGPASAPVPAGVTELARDERQWVAQRDASAASAALTQLHRRNR